MTDGDDDEVMMVARCAWDGFVLGRATGDWAAFLEVLSDDVTFFTSLPGPFQGENHGKRRAIQFAQYASMRKLGQFRFQKPIRVSREDATVVFEAWDEGTIAGESITNRVALSFDIEDAKVITVREYVGVMD